MTFKMTYPEKGFFVEPRYCFGESQTDQQGGPETGTTGDGNQVNFFHGLFYPVISRGTLRALAASNGIQSKFKNMFYVFDMFACGKRRDYSAVFGMEFDLRGNDIRQNFYFIFARHLNHRHCRFVTRCFNSQNFHVITCWPLSPKLWRVRS